MGAIISFLGGTAFRWVFGEIVGLVKSHVEHKQEIQLLEVQHRQARDQYEWRVAEVKSAADAGVQIIEAKREAETQGFMDRAFLAATELTGKTTGIGWVDAWNASIRPGLATTAIVLLVGQSLFPQHVVLTAFVTEVCGMALGIFVGGRITAKGN